MSAGFRDFLAIIEWSACVTAGSQLPPELKRASCMAVESPSPEKSTFCLNSCLSRFTHGPILASWLIMWNNDCVKRYVCSFWLAQEINSLKAASNPGDSAGVEITLVVAVHSTLEKMSSCWATVATLQISFWKPASEINYRKRLNKVISNAAHSFSPL